MSGEKFLRRRAVLARYGIGNSTLYDWIAAGKFPKPIVLVPGGRASAWLVEDLERFDSVRIAASQRGAKSA